MAIKTFTTGEVLTAADTNTYLANSGLVFVKQQTIGSGVSSVTVSDAFSTTYENYRITVTGIVPSATATTRLMIGSGRTNAHYGVMNYTQSNGGDAGTIKSNNSQSIEVVLTQVSVNNSQFTCDILSPFLTTRSTIIGTAFGRLYSCYFAGGDDSSSSYTSFTIEAASGTMTGGTITVHGYRKS